MWGLIFRNAGFFGGSGTTAPLTSLQADNNIYILAQQIIAKQTQGDSVVDVVQAGNSFYFLLSNHTYIGPVIIPTLSLNPRGVWLPFTNYAFNDLVTVGQKIYLVIYNHVSQATFDPNANDGMGHNYYQEFLDIGAAIVSTVATQTGSSYTIALTDAQTYIRFTNSGGCLISIPPNSSVAFPINTEIEFYQGGAGRVSVTAESPAEINPVTGFLDETAVQGSTIKIKKVTTDSWDISGRLEPTSG